MNRAQQQELIAEQTGRLQDCQEWRVLPSDASFQLHLDMQGRLGRRYHVMFDLEDYDILPPKLYILDEAGEITWSLNKVPPEPFRNRAVHPHSGRIFFCVKGTSDYHTHPLHKHQTWDALRNSWNLPRIVAEVSAALHAEPVPSGQSYTFDVPIPTKGKRVRQVTFVHREGAPPQAVLVYMGGAKRIIEGVPPVDRKGA